MGAKISKNSSLALRVGMAFALITAVVALTFAPFRDYERERAKSEAEKIIECLEKSGGDFYLTAESYGFVCDADEARIICVFGDDWEKTLELPEKGYFMQMKKHEKEIVVSVYRCARLGYGEEALIALDGLIYETKVGKEHER